MRISIHKEPAIRFTLKVDCYFGGEHPNEITDFGYMDASVLYFICKCYFDSINYKVKGNPFSECARNIQKRTGLPWEVCKLMVKLKNDEEINEAYYALDALATYLSSNYLYELRDATAY